MNAMHIVGKISWVVTALAGICIGLLPFGYDFMGNWLPMNMPSFVEAAHYLMGICGLISLVMFVMVCVNGCDKSCGC